MRVTSDELVWACEDGRIVPFPPPMTMDFGLRESHPLRNAAVQIAAGMASSGSWSIPHYGSGDNGETYANYRKFIANEAVLLAKAVLAKCEEG